MDNESVFHHLQDLHTALLSLMIYEIMPKLDALGWLFKKSIAKDMIYFSDTDQIVNTFTTKCGGWLIVDH